jgi:hypothetical protein
MFGIPTGIPGMTMSPDFCPARHGPSHFASIVVDADPLPIKAQKTSSTVAIRRHREKAAHVTFGPSRLVN